MSIQFSIPRPVLERALASLAISDPQKALHQAMTFLVRRFESVWSETDSLGCAAIPEVGSPDHCHHCQGPCGASGLVWPTGAQEEPDSESAFLQLLVDRDLLDTVAYIMVRGGGGCARAIVRDILQHGSELFRMGKARRWTQPTSTHDAYDRYWSLAPDRACFPGDLFRLNLEVELQALDLRVAQADAVRARRGGKLH